MKSTTQYSKNHFNLTEREVLIPLLDSHVEYLCRAIKSMNSFNAKIQEFHNSIPAWYNDEVCPEVAINEIFGGSIETHNNPRGFEAQYYRAQGHEHGYQRSRRVRYLWAALNQILAEDMHLSKYGTYNDIEEGCVSEVICPICGCVFARWTRQKIYRTHNDWYWSSWEFDEADSCEHLIFLSGTQQDTLFVQGLESDEKADFEEWVRDESNFKVVYDAENYEYYDCDHYYISNKTHEQIIAEFRDYMQQFEEDN